MRGGDQLRVDTNGCPHPHVTGVFWGLSRLWQVALLRIDEGPNLINLDTFAGKILESVVLVGAAGLARVNKKFDARVLATSAVRAVERTLMPSTKHRRMRAFVFSGATYSCPHYVTLMLICQALKSYYFSAQIFNGSAISRTIYRF